MQISGWCWCTPGNSFWFCSWSPISVQIFFVFKCWVRIDWHDYKWWISHDYRQFMFRTHLHDGWSCFMIFDTGVLPATTIKRALDNLALNAIHRLVPSSMRFTLWTKGWTIIITDQLHCKNHWSAARCSYVFWIFGHNHCSGSYWWPADQQP